MESSFDIDKVFDEIVCKKEAEIIRLKQIVEKLETHVSKQEALKTAKETFITTMAHIIQSNSLFPRKAKSWMAYRLWILKKVNKIIEFIDMFHTSWMLNVAKSLREDLLKFPSDQQISNYDHSPNWPLSSIIHMMRYSCGDTFKTYGEEPLCNWGGGPVPQMCGGVLTLQPSPTYNLPDLIRELFEGNDGVSAEITIQGHRLLILKQINLAIGDYLGAIINDIE